MSLENLRIKFFIKDYQQKTQKINNNLLNLRKLFFDICF